MEFYKVGFFLKLCETTPFDREAYGIFCHKKIYFALWAKENGMHCAPSQILPCSGVRCFKHRKKSLKKYFSHGDPGVSLLRYRNRTLLIKYSYFSGFYKRNLAHFIKKKKKKKSDKNGNSSQISEANRASNNKIQSLPTCGI